MSKKVTMLIAILCLSLTAVLFINAVPNDFNPPTGGLHQIKDISVDLNKKNEATIVLNMANSSNSVKPKIKILNEDEPVFSGEKKVKDPSLGKYRVELMLTDTRLQKKVRSRLGLKNNSVVSKDSLLQSIRVAYPPDDSLMVLYFGCNSKPNVDLQQENNQMIINLRK